MAPRRLALLRARGFRSRRSSLRRRSRSLACTLTADCLAHQPKRRLAPRRLALRRAQGWRPRGWPLRRRSRHLACILTAARAASQPGRRRTQPAILSTAATNPRLGATFLRLSGATSGNATVDAAVIAIRSPGAGAPLPICSRSTTCCRSPRAVARTCSMRITACATAMGRLCRRNAPCSTSSALLARRSTRLADGLQVDVAGRGTLRISARGACIFAAASSDPGRGLPSTNLPLPVIGTIGNDPLCSTASAPSIMAVNPCILLPASSLSHACRGSFCGCA